MDIDLRREPPTAQYIEAVREEEMDAQDVAWNSGSSVVLLAQATVLGMTAAILGWALGEVANDQVRNVDLDERGGLTLSASDQVPGTDVARHHRLQWERPDGGH